MSFFFFALATFGIFLSSITPTFANSPKRIYAGVGTLSQNLGQLTTNADQSPSLFTNFYPQISIFGVFPTQSRIDFVPRMFWTPLGHASSDGGSHSSFLALDATGSWSTGGHDNYILRFGPGLALYRISGNGGTISVNNGTSHSTFAFPDTSSTSRMLYWDFGAGFGAGRLQLDFDLWLFSAFSSKRSLTAVFSASYAISELWEENL